MRLDANATWFTFNAQSGDFGITPFTVTRPSTNRMGATDPTS